jgi:hypothetical protein
MIFNSVLATAPATAPGTTPGTTPETTPAPTTPHPVPNPTEAPCGKPGESGCPAGLIHSRQEKADLHRASYCQLSI